MSSIVAFLQGWGPLGVMLLVVLDSAGVPLPSALDAMMLLNAAANPSIAYPVAAASLVGSSIGCMILFFLARKGGELYLDKHAGSARAMKLREWFGRYGLLTVFIPALVPFIPLPLKVFVLSAGALGVRPLSFLLVIVAARVPRYFVLAYVGRELGEHSLEWFTLHKWQLLIGALGLFVVLYAAVRLADRGKREARD